MPGFFDEVDSTGIVEDHIKSVLRLEDDQAKTMLANYTEVRKDLVDRLSHVRGGSFTQQHLRGVLAQVEGAINAINHHLAGDLADGAYKAALKGVEHLTKELKRFDQEFLGAVTPINLNAALVAKDTSQFLVTKYQTNLDNYGRNLYGYIANGLFAASIGDKSYAQVIGSVSQAFTAEEWKLHRIVRTELHNIYNVGKINGMRELTDDLPDLKKTLMHPMDQRTGADSKYAARLGLVAEIDEPFSYVWRGQVREFMAPPDRPNDRAILVPYREDWGAARGPAFIPGTFPKA